MGRAKRPTGGDGGWMDGVCSCWLVGLSKDGSVKDGALNWILEVDMLSCAFDAFLGEMSRKIPMPRGGTWMVSTSNQ